MCIADFFHLTDDEYASRIKSYPDSQLLKQLQVKHMQVKFGGLVNNSSVAFGFMGKALGYFLEDNVIVPVVLGAIPTFGKRRVVLSTQKILLLEEELARRGCGNPKFKEAVERFPAREKVVFEQTMDHVLPSLRISRQQRMLIYALVLLFTFTIFCILKATFYLLPAALISMLKKRRGSIH
jgi:hypothetical protein